VFSLDERKLTVDPRERSIVFTNNDGTSGVRRLASPSGCSLEPDDKVVVFETAFAKSARDAIYAPERDLRVLDEWGKIAATSALKEAA